MEANNNDSTPSQLSTARVFLLGASLLLTGWTGFFFIPGMMVADAAGSRAVNAFYCSAITLTTYVCIHNNYSTAAVVYLSYRPRKLTRPIVHPYEYAHSVGYGDICPGDLTLFGRIFLIVFLLTGLGMFCGPIMELASSWQRQVPGGKATLASLAVGMGVSIFTVLEGLPHMEAVYASIITGRYCLYAMEGVTGVVIVVGAFSFEMLTSFCLACWLLSPVDYLQERLLATAT
jgi:hypothetical protein